MARNERREQPDAVDWRSMFVGRTDELDRLRGALESAAPALFGRSEPPRPSLVVLRGDSGVGKSRIVQEFYRRLADSSGSAEWALDPDDYWPDSFGDPDASAKLVNPEIPPGHCRGKSPPFLWWGVRWSEPPIGSASLRVELTHPSALAFLEAHRSGCRRRVGRAMRAAKLLGRLATNSVVPDWLQDPVVDFVRGGIERVGDSAEIASVAIDAGRAARRLVGRTDPSEEIASGTTGALRRVATLLRAILRPPGIGTLRDLAMPLILWLDDAHWMTPEEAVVVEDLVAFAARYESPLLVVATHWEREWNLAVSGRLSSVAASRRPQHGLPQMVSRLRSQRVGAGGVFIVELPLGQGRSAGLDLRGCLVAALPGLSRAQQDCILEKVAGVPLLLRLVVEELERHPERFVGGDRRNALLPDAEADLRRIAVSEAKRTFIGRKIRELTLVARRVLEVGTLQGGDFLRRVTRDAAVHRGLAREEVDRAIDEAKDLHAILDVGIVPGLLHFRQDLYRDILREEIAARETAEILDAIRRVLVETLANPGALTDGERGPLEELAARLLLGDRNRIDLDAAETRIWVGAGIRTLGLLEAEGLDGLALARAREILDIDARLPHGLPGTLLDERGCLRILPALTREAPDHETLGVCRRVSRRQLRSDGPLHGATDDLLRAVSESQGAIALRATYTAAIRGAEAALSAGDPLLARLTLEGAPADLRGPEHGMLAFDAHQPRRVLLDEHGGNAYRLRSVAGSDLLLSLSDGALEVVTTGEPARPERAEACFDLEFLGAGNPAMRLAVDPTPRGDAVRIAIGSTAYAEASRGPEVHLVEIVERDGQWHLRHLKTIESSFWGESAFTDDGTLAYATRSGGIGFLDSNLEPTAPILPMDGESGITAIATLGADRLLVAASGRLLLLASRDAAVPPKLLRDSLGRVTSIAVSIDGRFAAAAHGSAVTVVDLSSSEFHEIRVARSDVWDVAISPDASRVAIAGRDCMVHVAELASGKALGSSGFANGVTWSVVWNERELSISTEGRGVVAIDPKRLGAMARKDRDESGAPEHLRILDWAQATDGTLELRGGALVLTDSDGVDALLASVAKRIARARLIPRGRGRRAVIHDTGESETVEFVAPGAPPKRLSLPCTIGARWLPTSDGEAIVFLRHQSAYRLPIGLGGSAPLEPVAFAHDSELNDNFTHLGRRHDGTPVLGRLDGAVFEWRDEEPTLLFRATGWIQATCEYEDGTWIVGNHNGRVERIESGLPVWSNDLRRSIVRSIAVLPMEERALVLLAHGRLHALDLRSGEQLCTFETPGSTTSEVVWIARERRIAVLDEGRIVRSWLLEAPSRRG